MFLPVLLLGGLGLYLLWPRTPASQPLTPTPPPTLPPVPSNGKDDVGDLPSLQAQFQVWNAVINGTNKAELLALANTLQSQGFVTAANRVRQRAASLPG